MSVLAADVATVVTAGLAFSGKGTAAAGALALVIVVYWLDPLSVLFVGPVPFTWLHMVSLAVLVLLLALAEEV